MLREHIQTPRQQQAPLLEQIKNLHGERDKAMRPVAALYGENERLNRNSTELLK